MKKILATFLAVWTTVQAQQPVIFDTDYGPFIDDIFALGLIVNSGDLLDLQYVITTSEVPDLSARCAAEQLNLANRSDIPVGIGATFPDYSMRGGVCAVPGLIGFALEDACSNSTMAVDSDGVAAVAALLEASDRDDWWYIVVGGQTSVQSLIENYPEAADKISTLIVMGGNWCSGFEPYPDVAAPTDETNIACDPIAANAVLDGRTSPFDTIYYVPVVVADEIGGDDYIQIVESANAGTHGAKAIVDFYRTWSEAGRANEDLLIHIEAMTYDPETESTPQFDACAVMLALQLLDESTDDRLVLVDVEAVHFFETTDEGLAAFPEAPRSAFSLLPEGFEVELPDTCPNLTKYVFDPVETPEEELPVKVALGFASLEAKDSFYAEMAQRMAGTFPPAMSANTTESQTTSSTESPVTSPIGNESPVSLNTDTASPVTLPLEPPPPTTTDSSAFTIRNSFVIVVAFTALFLI